MGKKSFFVGMLCIVLVFGLLIAGCDTGNGDQAGTPHNLVVTARNLTDYVTAPAVGATPAASLAGNPPEYTGSIAWDPGDASFAGNIEYTATVTLTAKSGYEFEGVPVFVHTGAKSVNSTAGGGGSITVTVVFDPIFLSGLYVGDSTSVQDVSDQNGNGLIAKSLAWLGSNASVSTAYTIKINADETLAPVTLSSANLHSASDVTVTLTTVNSTPRTVQLSEQGEIFRVESNVTLILAGHVIIKGIEENNTRLVRVDGGTLELKDSAKITGNSSTSTSDSGGGVVIHSGTFNMSDGEISGNHILEGGGSGVRIYSDSTTSTFNMSGGTISGNTSTHGSGVFMNNNGTGSTSTFNMSGGTISGNTATSSQGGMGGGVAVHDRSPAETSSGGTNTFTMTGGTISNNTATMIGGGVFIMKNQTTGSNTFDMSGGAISGNTAAYGGGIALYHSNFAKTGPASITGNTADSSAKAVLVLKTLSLEEDNIEASRDADAGSGDDITVTWAGSTYTSLTGVTH
jgi:hypothetical protein